MGTGKRLFVCSVLATLAFAGCGGGDDDGESTAASVETTPLDTGNPSNPLTKEQMIVRGGAFCAEVNAAIGAVEAGGGSDEEKAIQVARLYTGMVEQLEELLTPRGYEEVIEAGEELSQAESDVALAAERGDADAFDSAEEKADEVLDSFQLTMLSYGYQECGEPPAAPTSSAVSEESSGEESTGGVEEAAPEVAEEAAPETGGAGSVEEESAGGGASAGGGTGGGTSGSAGGGSSGGVGPG